MSCACHVLRHVTHRPKRARGTRGGEGGEHEDGEGHGREEEVVAVSKGVEWRQALRDRRAAANAAIALRAGSSMLTRGRHQGSLGLV